jgi:small conductance mechanosensitive channel
METAFIMFLFTAPPQVPATPVPDETLASVWHGWHADTIAFVRHELPRLVVILFFAFILLQVVGFFVNRMRALADSQTGKPQRASEIRTVASVVRATAYAVIGFIVLLHVLSVFGEPVTPLLASAGVLGVGVGLGAQSLFKDIINGVFILIENQYNVGDTVKIASLTGGVEDLTLRCTTLRDGDGTLYIIPNSQIATVANFSRDFAVATLSLVVDASADPNRVLALLRATALAVRNDPAFKSAAVADPDVPGIDSIAGRAVTYPISIRVAINQKDAILRELRRRILQAFEENSIPLGTDPANLLLHPHADPTAPPAQQPLTGT